MFQRFAWLLAIAWGWTFVGCLGEAVRAEEPYWVKPMSEVHARFRGTPGYVAQLGDSITYSMAFWTPIGWDKPDKYLTGDDGLPKRPPGSRWRDTLKGFRDKGRPHGNGSGWKVGNVLAVLDSVLEKKRPEMALVMLGTNDISGGKVPDAYRPGLERIVRKCLDAGCVPILNTIPPRRDRDEAVEQANEIIRRVAKKFQVPLADYHAACLKHRPGETWQGTIISDDGVHPTGGKSNIYTDENLKNCGYALRNWVNFLAVREVYFRVIAPK